MLTSLNSSQLLLPLSGYGLDDMLFWLNPVRLRTAELYTYNTDELFKPKMLKLDVNGNQIHSCSNHQSLDEETLLLVHCDQLFNGLIPKARIQKGR